MVSENDNSTTTQGDDSAARSAPSDPLEEMSRLRGMPEWKIYAESPSGLTLARLAQGMSNDRIALSNAVEALFFETENWRVAQHAALLHMGRFTQKEERVDLVKALCFAGYACELSKDDPRARLAMGRVSWERRLPLAVFHDVEVVRAGEAKLGAEVDRKALEAILAEACVLEGMAQAYLRDVERAQRTLAEAERLGGLTLEAVVQLLVVAEPDFPEVSLWAAIRMPVGVPLGGRASGIEQRAQRRRLLRLFLARGLRDEN